MYDGALAAVVMTVGCAFFCRHGNVLLEIPKTSFVVFVPSGCREGLRWRREKFLMNGSCAWWQTKTLVRGFGDGCETDFC
jgi:hypothetical protein